MAWVTSHENIRERAEAGPKYVQQYHSNDSQRGPLVAALRGATLVPVRPDEASANVHYPYFST